MTRGDRNEPPAVEIAGLSKRYRGQNGGMVPLPSLFGRFRRSGPNERKRGDGMSDADVDIDIDDDDADIEPDEEEEFELEERSDEPVWALRDVSLDVAPGTMLGIVGPNGAGKSTLLRVITRLTPPTEGKVVLRGRAAPLIASMPGVMQRGESLRRNVVQVGKFYGIPKEVAVARTQAVAELAELDGMLDQRVSTLSKGQLQRFAFAIALQLEPDILVADDIISVGDKHFQQRCLAHIRERVEEGLTVLFASHQLDRVRDLCTEAILIEEGRIVERGTTSAVLDRYAGAGGAGAATAAVDPAVSGPLSSAGLFTTAGQPTASLHASEPALLEVALDLPRAPMTIRCAIALRGPDWAAHAAQPSPFTVEEPGRYMVSAFLPPRTLANGTYRGDVAVSEFTEEGRRPLGRIRDAFEFEVYGIPDEPADESAQAETVAPLKRQVNLTWSVSRVEDRIGS